MPKLPQVELHGDLSSDDHDSEVAAEFESEVAVALAEPEAIDFEALERFVESYGPARLASPASWAVALGLEGSELHCALQARELSLVSRPSAADNHRRESGLKAADVLTWMQKRSIPFVLTEIARAALGTPTAEAVRLREWWSLQSAVEALGVDFDSLRSAIQKGHLRSILDPNTAASISRIEPQSLLQWLESHSVPVKLSLDFCAYVVRSRHARSGSTEEPAGRGVVDTALDSLTDQLAADAADEAANLRAMRQCYATILRRRNEPLPGDAQDLAELVKQLEISRDQVIRDVATLESAAELEAQVKTIDRVTVELEAAGEASTELKSRHKIEADEARARLRSAQTSHAIAVRSPFELESLKASRPELFE